MYAADLMVRAQKAKDDGMSISDCLAIMDVSKSGYYAWQARKEDRDGKAARKLWELRGRVNIRNVNGLIFRSEELFWDGIKHEFYSYKFSRVITPERTMEGTYFRSDEHMTHYEVTNSVGSFQASDMEPEPEPAPAVATTGTASQPADSTQPPAPPVRQAATRRAATQKSVYNP
jgi:hypothetical protein